MQAASRAALAESLEWLGQRTGSSPDPAALREVSDGMFAASDLLAREPGLRRALADPATPAEVRAQLLDGLLGQRLDPRPLSFLRGLVSSRWSTPSDLVEAVETVGQSALLIAAEAEGALDDVEDELFRFGRIVDREPALRSALTDPGVPVDRRLPLLHGLVEDRTRPDTVRLLDRVVTDPLGWSFDRALEQAVSLAARRRQELLAVVRVAAALTEQQVTRLSEALSRSRGQHVRVQVDVDPAVLGGAVVTIGDEVIDGSIARRIDTVRRRLRR